MVILAGSPGASANSGGLLDTGFGDKGRVVTGFGDFAAPFNGQVSDVEFDSKGRIVLGVSSSEYSLADPLFFVVRLRSNGSLDPDFSGDGMRQVGFGTDFDLAPDDTVYVAGPVGRSGPGREIRMTRILTDGTIDNSFGNRGSVITDSVQDNQVDEIFVQPGGEVVVFIHAFCHATRPGCGGITSSTSTALQYSRGGRLLSRSYTGSEELGSVLMLADGRFIATGSTNEGEGSVILLLAPNGAGIASVDPDGSFPFGNLALQSGSRIVANGQWGIGRLLADLTTSDPSFDTDQPGCPNAGGDFLSLNFSGDLEVLPDDRLVASARCGVVRLKPDGGVDPSFADSGFAIVPEADRPFELGLDDQGRTLLAVGSDGGETAGLVRVHRLDENGSRDPGFGDDGTVTIPVTAILPKHDGAEALAVDRDGRLVSAGFSSCPRGACRGVALARHLPGGGLDRSFGGDGRVSTLGVGLRRINSVVAQADGSLAVAGERSHQAPGGPGQAAFIARYTEAGQLDTSFGGDGIVDFQPSSPAERTVVGGLARQRDGKLLITGYGYKHSGSLFGFVARFRSNGALDRSFAADGVLRIPQRVGFLPVMAAITTLADGQIVATGGDSGWFRTLRLEPDGSFDRSFSGDGFVNTRTGSSSGARAIVVSPSGEMTVGGGAAYGRGVVVRYRSDGRIDPRFGAAGLVRLPGIGISDLALTRCGLFAFGTSVRDDKRLMSVAHVPDSGSAGKVGRYRFPFGRVSDSYGAEMAPVNGRRNLVLAGRFEATLKRGDFALSKLRGSQLAGRCSAR
jgi:uncharacterized delta-60 repeat protein